MSNPNRHTPFNRTLRDTRLAFSNLRHLFDSGSNVVFTWYEILAGLSILSFLTLLVFLALHFALWLASKEPPFSVAICKLLVFPIWFFPAVEFSAHFDSVDHPQLACHFGRNSCCFRLLDWRHQHLIAAPTSNRICFLLPRNKNPSPLWHHKPTAFMTLNGWNSMLR